MKKYKFKLEAILKVRKLKEEKCKMEIGRLQVEINNLKNELDKHNSGIDDSYLSQEKGLADGMNGHELRFHPYFVAGKKAHIDQITAQINMLQSDVEKKYDELKFLRADVKVIEEMKEKDKVKYKKALEKKQFAEIEEQVQNWKQIIQR